MAFKPGQIVRMKSGGPDLTVLSADEETASCLFFSEELGEFKETDLPVIALEGVDPDDDEDDDEGDEEDEEEKAA
ncbi:MAG: hypothetical protein BGP06_03240 [Rhizobiales bacterium 65-9]|nr:DUF2158 domain-containing protein [Hyphomicrobiales bacterium]OJY35869.1 MAG: hypothetical protein BGP06_03240 [Rhizobiales bacterium 65-9]